MNYAFLTELVFIQVVLVDVTGKIGQGMQRQNYVFVEFEGIGAGGNGAQALTVAPETGGLVAVGGYKNFSVRIFFK